MRTVWVSFDVIGRRCVEACAEAGAQVVGIVTLPGPVDPNRSGQCRFDDLAEELGAELIESAEINSPDTVASVRDLEPGSIFVVGWSQLVYEELIATANDGVFGMHPSLLPKHRGRAPIPWAILSGLAKTGVTLFEIADPTADSGAIVGQVELSIAEDETATTLYGRIEEAHVELIREYVPQLTAGTAPRIPQDATRASSWPKRTPADGIIDWETRAPYLDAWVRAQTRPYPGAFTFLGPAKLVVWRARPVELDGSAAAGTVVEERPEGVVVACGEGGLLLEEVESELEPLGEELAVGARLG
jgi:methionyl-tRNA formyltransferase